MAANVVENGPKAIFRFVTSAEDQLRRVVGQTMDGQQITTQELVLPPEDLMELRADWVNVMPRNEGEVVDGYWVGEARQFNVEDGEPITIRPQDEIILTGRYINESEELEEVVAEDGVDPEQLVSQSDVIAANAVMMQIGRANDSTFVAELSLSDAEAILRENVARSYDVDWLRLLERHNSDPAQSAVIFSKRETV